MKLTQVSGSISLELGKVVRETAKATLAGLLTRTAPEGEVTPLEEISGSVAASVTEAVMPVLAILEILEAKIDRMTALLEDVAKAEAIVRRATGTQPAASVLEWDNLVATLSHHLPAGTSHPSVGDGFKVAEFQASHLAEAGYAIVPVSGEALAGTVATQEAHQPAVTFAGMDVERADARLAEARRNGADDSWYEGARRNYADDSWYEGARRNGADDSWYEGASA